MKYLLLVHHNEEAFAKMSEAVRSDMLAESIKLCHQLNGNGQYVHASPLQPTSTATCVRVRDGKRSITDGPFIETREQLAGYFLIEAKILTTPSPWPAGFPARGSGRWKSGRCGKWQDCRTSKSQAIRTARDRNGSWRPSCE